MYEEFIGVAFVIAVALILIAVLTKPIVRGILKEVRAYHQAEMKDALDSVSKLLGSIAGTALALMYGNASKNPFEKIIGGNTPSETKQDE